MRHKGAIPEVAVAEMAACQHGVVSAGQLEAAGFSRSGVVRGVRAGRLHRLHRGVYAVGHPGVSRLGRWMAAVIAVGDGAVISHLSAAALFGLLPALESAIHVSVPGVGGRRQRDGIRVHRRTSLPPSAVTGRRNIPVTTSARTLADIEPIVSPAQFRRAVRQAAVLGLSVGSMVRVDRTRSELEFLFLDLCRHAGLPMPAVNVRIGSSIVDFLWREHRLIVETDGYRYHRGLVAFEDDCSRDLALRALGYEVIRLSHRQVTAEPDQTVAALRRSLSP